MHSGAHIAHLLGEGIWCRPPSKCQAYIHRKTDDRLSELRYSLGQSRDIELAVRLGRPPRAAQAPFGVPRIDRR